MKKITWFSDYPLKGSSFATVTHHLCSRLSKFYEINVLALGYNGQPLTIEGYKILPIDSTAQIDFYNRHLKKDLTIIFHSFYLLDKLGIANFSGKKILYIPVEAERIPSKYYESLNTFDRILTPSKYSQKVIDKFGFKSDVVYHGIESEFFIPNPETTPTHWFGFLGLNDLRKQIPKLFEAYSRLNLIEPNLLIGTTNEGHYDLNTLALDFGIKPTYLESKLFNIPLGREKILDFYNKIRIYSQCSSESFGLPSLEAASCNLPNIALDHGASKEILDDSALYVKTACTLETNLGPIGVPDVEDLYTKMNSLLHDEKLRNELGNKGRNRAKMFNWKEPTSKLIEIIEEEIL